MCIRDRAISALVAVGIYMLGSTSPVVQALSRSPLRWVIMLAPMAFILVLSFRFEKMSYSALLGTFWAFAATTVSYTHLDVYKRQIPLCPRSAPGCITS